MYLKKSLAIKLALKHSVLTQGSRLVSVLRRFDDSLTLGNKLYRGWVGRLSCFSANLNPTISVCVHCTCMWKQTLVKKDDAVSMNKGLTSFSCFVVAHYWLTMFREKSSIPLFVLMIRTWLLNLKKKKRNAKRASRISLHLRCFVRRDLMIHCSFLLS